MNSTHKRFDIIVTIDSDNGIGKNNGLPWSHSKFKASNPQNLLNKDKKSSDLLKYEILEDHDFFCKLTRDHNLRNAVIIGRKTWESIGSKPLKHCLNIVITSAHNVDSNKSDHYDPDIIIFARTLNDGLSQCTSAKIDNIFVCGGVNIYSDAIIHPLCKNLYITKINHDYGCNIKFPVQLDQLLDFGFIQSEQKKLNDLATVFIFSKTNPSEKMYLNVMAGLLSKGDFENNVSDNRFYSKFGLILRYPLKDPLNNKILPLFTNKNMSFKAIYEGLLNSLSIDENVDTQSLDNTLFNNSSNFHNKIEKLIHWLKSNPHPTVSSTTRFVENHPLEADEHLNSRRNSVLGDVTQDSYINNNPAKVINTSSVHNELGENVLLLDDVLQIYNVINGQLSIHITIPSDNMFLDHPCNVAKYAILAHIVAEICGFNAKEIIVSIANGYVYEKDKEEVELRRSKECYSYPTIKFHDNIIGKSLQGILSVSDFTFDSIILNNYCFDEELPT